jgi:hypothetical protein
MSWTKASPCWETSPTFLHNRDRIARWRSEFAEAHHLGEFIVGMDFCLASEPLI